jgi:hypothetical protein
MGRIGRSTRLRWVVEFLQRRECLPGERSPREQQDRLGAKERAVKQARVAQTMQNVGLRRGDG